MWDAEKSYLNDGDDVVFNASGYLVYGRVTAERTRNKTTRKRSYNWTTRAFETTRTVETLDEVEITYRDSRTRSDKKTWTSNSRAVLKI